MDRVLWAYLHGVELKSKVRCNDVVDVSHLELFAALARVAEQGLISKLEEVA